jgi:ElaB/YqjD/DUF883 family membrane-anchored ribosome-binding protein
MIRTGTLRDNWSEVKHRLHQRWNQLTDEDLDRWEGDVRRLVRTIRKKTGDSREHVERFLAELASDAGSATQRASRAVRQYARGIADQAQGAALNAADAARAGVAHTERAVRRRPFEAAALTFAVGLVAGVALGFVFRSK